MGTTPPDLGLLYDRHQQTLLRFFARRTGDGETALDLWSETFAQAARGRRKCRATSDDALAAWLFGIARNQLNLYLRDGYAHQRAVRKLKLERPPVTEDLLGEVEQRAGLPEIRTTLGTAMSALSQETRLAVELRVVEELPYSEVARKLGIAETAARARVSRGLSRLADLLDRDILTEVTS